ncbi:Efflux transporter, RND family, MFP subunit [Elusimicrobium minutum Pei191]|uniref:Efflux transporter, RND family, MFP subunit n=1 Tax=Elusimicrobium minutum (strain Pei191) TaxID=445932 RepID=B2KDY2_ELUMP|nr:efflux RND transporter periplasmic adaptor subunit [Elusimicrobium minutum]ACC98728.1 Efflux transporter, RND family, MFP subunit [Elusimicrobium minutum Pei191]
MTKQTKEGKIKSLFNWFKKLSLLKKSLILLPLIIVIIFLITRGGDKIFYETEPVRIGSIREVVEASGTINPVSQTEVGTQVSGTIYKLYVDFNSPVKRGQLLAEIDPATLRQQVLQQEASLMKAQSELTNSQRTYERYQQLYAQNFVSKSELDQAETTYLTNQANTIQAKASLAKAKTDLDYTRITSPVDGIVISRAVDLGQTVAASFNTPTLFLVAQDLTKMQIEVPVSEADIIKVQEGQNVTFTIDGYPSVTFKGVVNQVRLSPETVQGMVAYTVIIMVDNPELKLKPGMTANVTIITQEKDDAKLVPNAALRFTPKSSTEKYRSQGIWVLTKQGPERIDIKTGIMDDKNTEIISDQINVGDEVIIAETTNAKQKKSLFAGPQRQRRR